VIAPPELEYKQYLRLDMMPHILCPGCGHGIVLKAILRAIHRLGLRREEVVFVSGIGCSSRIVGYIDFCTLHTTHGRPLTFATGLKLARPDLRVIVITGDGDGLAIGGNHLIHAARRNIGVTCLLLNNAIYGMTGGQGAPTTPEGALSKTNPDGTVEPSFDACRLALGAGASFVGRGFTATPLELDDLIARAVEHKGFSFVEIFSDCPEYFGRYNTLGRGPEMLHGQRAQMDSVSDPLTEKQFVCGLETSPSMHLLQTSLSSGVLHQEARPEFAERLAAIAGTPSKAGKVRPASTSPVLRASSFPSPSREGEGAGEGGHETPHTGRKGTRSAAPRNYQMRLAGAGGQGIVLAGLLLAEAAVAAGKNATHAQAYGPESRGGASKAEVIVSDGEIDYPYADHVDLLLALTQEAYEQYVPQLVPGGILLVDADRVRPAPAAILAVHALPLGATAQRVLGTPLGANVVALGALVGISGVVPPEAAEQALAARKPGGSAETALRAFRAGLALVGASR
jgi:2-oxoglutarate ferredoxin oxidoreductase subunit beta